MCIFFYSGSGEEYYDYYNYITNPMVGQCRDVNYMIYEAGRLVFLSDCEIASLRVDGIGNGPWKQVVN